MRKNALLGGFAGFASIALLAGCGGSESSEPTKPSADVKAEAASVCQKAVSDELKDPASAQFRDVSVSNAQAASDATKANSFGVVTATLTGGQYWTVTGEVNAANSFGGMVGFKAFSCEATLYEGSQMESGYVDIK